MAPAARNNPGESGQALIEGVEALALLSVFTTGVLLALYVTFATGWIHYQSEQGLYCAAQTDQTVLCARQMQKAIAKALPGSADLQVRITLAQESWRSEVEWKIQKYKITIRRELSLRAVLRRRDLHWSARSY